MSTFITFAWEKNKYKTRYIYIIINTCGCPEIFNQLLGGCKTSDLHYMYGHLINFSLSEIKSSTGRGLGARTWQPWMSAHKNQLMATYIDRPMMWPNLKLFSYIFILKEKNHY